MTGNSFNIAALFKAQKDLEYNIQNMSPKDYETYTGMLKEQGSDLLPFVLKVREDLNKENDNSPTPFRMP
ncbi:hypothetical protein [Piscirickettsia litoralis]|uniref:Uncharacterized protein n=1 Tax=Piscirickettsia litoralis TaxID=1891921 RepID=A0ABX2ZXF9_9GAMM|nr:hypothetical protein [Piscirickettsia litoralis]ODN41064.1 hypothetical protein BGC07_18120 [Piscirickettsia litoralis]